MLSFAGMASAAEVPAPGAASTFKTIGTVYDCDVLQPSPGVWGALSMKPNNGSIDTADVITGAGSFAYKTDGAEDAAIWFTKDLIKTPIDVSGAEMPALSLWFKMEDVSKIAGEDVQIFFRDGGNPDPASSVGYYIDKTTLKNGWNNIILPIYKTAPAEETYTVNGIKFNYAHNDKVDFTKLDVLQIQIKTTEATTVKYDDIRFVDLKKAQALPTEDANYKTIGTICNFDTLQTDGAANFGTWGSTPTINTTDKKEGAGCLEYVVESGINAAGNYNVWFGGVDAPKLQDKAINLKDATTPAISFWFWIEDASVLDGDIMLHLATTDEQVAEVDPNKAVIWLHSRSIKNGWNHFVVRLERDFASVTPPEFTSFSAQYGMGGGAGIPDTLKGFAFTFPNAQGQSMIPEKTVIRIDDAKVVDMAVIEGDAALPLVEIVSGEGVKSDNQGNGGTPSTPDSKPDSKPESKPDGNNPGTGDMLPIPALSLLAVSGAALMVVKRMKK